MGSSKSKPVGTIVIIGLDHAGKSTVINYLKSDKEKTMDVAPTVGFQSEQFKYNGSQFTCFDMSGAKQYRPLWRENVDSCEGVIFVIDASDSLRLCVAETELADIVQIIPSHVPILFLANKCDQTDALMPDRIVEKLNIQNIVKQHKWQIFATNGLSGSGITESMSWLTTNMPSNKKKK